MVTKKLIHRVLAGTLAALLLALTSCSSDAPEAGVSGETSGDERETITITDEVGREVEIEVPIRAVYPDLHYQTEVVRAIGAGETIVAIDESSDPDENPAQAEYFAELADLPQAGDYNQPNWETIASSGAEIFFARRNSPWQDAVEKLTPFGIEVVVVTAWDPVVLRENLPLLGEIFGQEEGAAELAELYDDINDLLSERLDGVEKKTVYFENNNDFVTSIPGSGWHDTIELAGGENLFADVNVSDDSSASVHEYEVDPVAIIERNPDVILHNGVDGQTSGYDSWDAALYEQQAQAIADRAGWDQISAVQSGDVYVFNNFLYSAFGKEIGALALATWLHPELFEDVDIDDYFSRWLEAQGVTPRPASDYFHQIGA